MILVARDIQAKNLVEGALPGRWRPTTYDATVGYIIRSGTAVTTDYFILPPRGMVWVVSNEVFHLTDDITGIATLKTSWTHKGILALNVGVVDPGWDGPLSAALVNFSNENFEVAKNEAFLRIVFAEHKSVEIDRVSKSKEKYVKDTKELSARMADSFLDIQSLSKEVQAEINSSNYFSLKWARVATWVALIAAVISVASIFFPVAWTVYVDGVSQRAALENLRKDVDQLQSKQKKINEMQMRRVCVLDFCI